MKIKDILDILKYNPNGVFEVRLVGNLDTPLTVIEISKGFSFKKIVIGNGNVVILTKAEGEDFKFFMYKLGELLLKEEEDVNG